MLRSLALAALVFAVPALAKGSAPSHQCMKDGQVIQKSKKECVKDGGKWEKIAAEPKAAPK